MNDNNEAKAVHLVDELYRLLSKMSDDEQQGVLDCLYEEEDFEQENCLRAFIKAGGL